MEKSFVKRSKWLVRYVICAIVMLATICVVATGCAEKAKVTPIDMTVDALKMEGMRDEVGATQIRITGQRRDYLFREDELKLKIEDFDCYKNIRQKESDSVVYFPEQGRGCVCFEAERSDRTYTDTLRLYFTDNFDRIVLRGRGGYAYIGSGSGTYTPQDCADYFQENRSGWDFVEEKKIDMKLDCVSVDGTGKEIMTVQLDIGGYYRDYLVGNRLIYLSTNNKFDNRVAGLTTPDEYKMHIREIPERGLTFVLLILGGYIPDKMVEEVFFLFTTDEFDRFIIADKLDGIFYVGSVSGNYTTREIVEYFNEFTNTGITLPDA